MGERSLKWHWFLGVTLALLACLAQANQLNGVRVWPSPESTRVVLDVANTPDYSYFTLKSPDRLVIDLKQTREKFDPSQLKIDSPLVSKVRWSKPPNKGTLRLVLELKRAVRPVLFPLSPTHPYGHRLVVDLFDTAPKHKTKPVVAPQTGERDIVIAIDAGHGGEDPGSIGPSKRYEKHITLQIAKRLQSMINAERGLSAVLTRTGDYYISVAKRSEIARRKKADVLISIHADAFTSPQPNGASVWTLSMRRANTEIGRWMENSEQHSELLGGAAEVLQDSGNEKYVARTLLDMSMDHSMVESNDVAARVVYELSRVTKMHKKKPVQASLGVLKSPDIPSVLVETGFISNPKEERLLTQKHHQQKIAKAILAGLKKYYQAKPIPGTYYAKNKARKHKVSSGESLSLLAKRYNVSVKRLKDANRLKNDNIQVGQVLSIPSS